MSQIYFPAPKRKQNSSKMFRKQPCIASLLALVMVLGYQGNNSQVSAESCACAAEELGFEINCLGETALLAALGDLSSNSCNSDCSSAICVRNWMVVQSHHDYCPEEGLPQEIEDDFHDFDTMCGSSGCDSSRKAQTGAEDCPIPNCGDSSGEDAYLSLAASGCLTDCSNCKSDFLTLRTVHDSCPHDTLSQAAEEILHDFEVPCAMHQCNVPGTAGGDSQLVCDDHDHDHDHDHGDDHGDDKDAALTSDAGVCSMTKTIMSFVVAAGAAVVIY